MGNGEGDRRLRTRFHDSVEFVPLMAALARLLDAVFLRPPDMSTDGAPYAPPSLDESPLRFDVAHPNAPSKETVCSGCAEPIHSAYYEVEGSVVCAGCHEKVSLLLRGGTGGRFARACVFGLLAAFAAAACYGGFRMATGYDVGLVAILVGFVVGKAVHLGAGGLGGRRYQLLAAVLTYLAIALSYVPGVVQTAHAPASPGVAAGILAQIGSAVVLVASLPVLVGLSSIISLFLLALALSQAWRMNRRVQARITGPYRLATSQREDLAAT